MSFLNRLSVKYCAKIIGKDQFGNCYYESNQADYLDRKKRYVVYNGLEEPSKVPSSWHKWLHHLTDNKPEAIEERYSWQKDHLPNLTGTRYAYSPYEGNKKSFLKYQAWRP